MHDRAGLHLVSSRVFKGAAEARVIAAAGSAEESSAWGQGCFLGCTASVRGAVCYS